MVDNEKPSAVGDIFAQGKALEVDEIGSSRWPHGSMRRITLEHFGLADRTTRRPLQHKPAARSHADEEHARAQAGQQSIQM